MAPVSQAVHKPRHTGSISFPDLPDGQDIDKGVVLVNGSSPNAKVTILTFDGDRKAGHQVDILRRCTITNDGKTLVIKGQSARAIQEFKLKPPDDEIEVRVRIKACADCGYA